jgi:hypothetical protein
LEVCGAPGERINHIVAVIGYDNAPRPPLVRDFNNLAKEGAKNGISHRPLLTDRKPLHLLEVQRAAHELALLVKSLSRLIID